ncbi:MAG: hypothetical protein ACE5FD_03515 [Anaerolineae bacterium]
MTTAKTKGFLRFFALFLPALLVTVYCFSLLVSGEVAYAEGIGEPAFMEAELTQTYGLTAVPEERTHITLPDDLVLGTEEETVVSNESRPVTLSKRVPIKRSKSGSTG